MLPIRKKRLAPTIGLLLFTSALAFGDPITVSPVVTQSGSTFHYDYSISNTTGLDLPVLDVAVTPGPTVTNLMAPAGFQSAFDSVLGLVSFLEDTDVFSPSPISGFMFDSLVGPSSTSFTATLLDANFNVSTMSGSTIGPAGSAAVPEPASLWLLAIAFCLLGLSARQTLLRTEKQ